jgi:hypothetical protein
MVFAEYPFDPRCRADNAEARRSLNEFAVSAAAQKIRFLDEVTDF